MAVPLGHVIILLVGCYCFGAVNFTSFTSKYIHKHCMLNAEQISCRRGNSKGVLRKPLDGLCFGKNQQVCCAVTFTLQTVASMHVILC